MTAQAPVISRKAVARSFSAAAATYDIHADLQRCVVDELMQGISPDIQPRTILNLGSGTGYCSDQLSVRFPQANIVNLDLAEGMLNFHQSRKASSENHFVCADASQLPFLPETFDLLFSSLTVQWCADLQKVFGEVQRVCADGAEVVISTLGPGTLQEVSELWSQIDAYRHVNRFMPKEEICSHAESAGLEVTKISSCMHQRSYLSLQSLAAELKGLGAHNLNPDQAQGLTGRRKIRELQKFFEQKKVNGRFITGFEVLLLQMKARL